MNDASAPARPTMAVRHPDADKVAAVDAIGVAARIVANGARAAIGASTVEMVALARHTLALQNLADLTYDLLATSDRLLDETLTEAARRALMRQVDTKIAVVGASLEALGYGQNPEPQQGEKTNVATQD